jgi:hypothetical protein
MDNQVVPLQLDYSSFQASCHNIDPVTYGATSYEDIKYYHYSDISTGMESKLQTW